MGEAGAIEEDEAQCQLSACEKEMKSALRGGLDTGEAERSLNVARSCCRKGEYDRAFVHAVRGRRLLREAGLDRLKKTVKDRSPVEVHSND